MAALLCAARRRSSLVAHEEAAFEVKVTAWQRKIDDEDGTETEVNLRKKKSGAAETEDVVVKRQQQEARKIKRPLSSYGVICALTRFCCRNPTPTPYPSMFNYRATRVV